ncbi:hypothetical protein SEPCBS119000_002845 [Sporothrix epigloea]|uniref:DUF1308 domain-containing protein n=1 Tax=Sporothrix epigloea TaxID=1892477 RepID=A0ABP0DIE1_9PEZI
MESRNVVQSSSASPTPCPVDDSPAGLVARWTVLINEYEAFQDALRVCMHQPYWPGVRPYITMLQVEARQAERLEERARDGDHDNDSWRGEHRLAATTLAAKEGMWRIIKTSRGVLALERRFAKPTARCLKEEMTEGCVDKKMMPTLAGTRHEGIFVNAVVDNGREWLRVLTTTSAQLIAELAENGWDWGEGEEDEDKEEESEDELSDIADMSLVKMVHSLVEAAQTNRCKGAYPRICVILTRIEEAEAGVEWADQEAARRGVQIARYLGRVRRGFAAYTAQLPPDIDGKHVDVTIHSMRAARTNAQPSADPGIWLPQLLPDLADRLTATVNIDTSILISLASDITHDSVPPEPWHPPQRRDEMSREAKHPGRVLKTLMDEALRGRRLVCTREAATAFRTMVHDMAQPSEQERARCLLGELKDEAGAAVDRPTLVQRYRALSKYPHAIPDNLLLPIEVQDTFWSLEQVGRVSCPSQPTAPAADNNLSLSPSLPAVAYRIAQDMANANPTLAVFFFGWAAGHTTITTNLVARNRIALLLERYRTSSYEKGPLVWVCRTARSLNGTNPREGRRDGKDKTARPAMPPAASLT